MNLPIRKLESKPYENVSGENKSLGDFIILP